MGFKAYEEIAEDPRITLPIRGHEYVICPPSAKTGLTLGLRLAAGVAAKAGVTLKPGDVDLTGVTDDDLPDFARQCLNGPWDGQEQHVYEQMLDDGLTFAEIEHAVATAFLAWTVDREAAELYWNSAGKAPSPSLSGLPPTETPTPSAAANTGTGSATGTTRRKARARANKAARSAGSSRTTTTS